MKEGSSALLEHNALMVFIVLLNEKSRAAGLASSLGGSVATLAAPVRWTALAASNCCSMRRAGATVGAGDPCRLPVDEAERFFGRRLVVDLVCSTSHPWVAEFPMNTVQKPAQSFTSIS